MRLNSRGDTIVEVLIATAIVGMLLTGSFAVANRSSQVIRSAQERSEAQKITTRMVERLKSRSVRPPQPFTPPVDKFCFDASGVQKNAATDCKDGLYTTFIESTPQAYVITTTWDSVVSGVGQEQLVIRYKVL